MYKLCYYPSESSSKIGFKEFDTIEDAFEFLFRQKSGTLIELKYYPDNYKRKSDRT